jgi:hypothetical protein
MEISIKLSDGQIDKIQNQWTKLPNDVKDKYKYLLFNIVDKRELSSKDLGIVNGLFNKHLPKEPTQNNNIQYVSYSDNKLQYIDQLYNINKKMNFISKLIKKANKNGKLTKSEDYYLMYYLKKGETPYHYKLLPNNI